MQTAPPSVPGTYQRLAPISVFASAGLALLKLRVAGSSGSMVSPAQAATLAPEPATGAAGASAGQYRWGADRKRALLAHERRVVA